MATRENIRREVDRIMREARISTKVDEIMGRALVATWDASRFPPILLEVLRKAIEARRRRGLDPMSGE
jgi:hypothetical protein